MSFNITNIGTYIQNGTGYAMKAVAEAPTFAKLISTGNVTFGVHGQQAIRKISNNMTLLDGSSCSRTGGSNITLGTQYINIVPIKSEDNICDKTLWNSFYAYSVQKGQTPQPEFVADFANALMEQKVEIANYQQELLAWQGDTSLTGTTNLKRMDGFLKQGTVSATTGTVTGATIVEKLQNVYLSASTVERGQTDFFIAIGRDTYDAYLIALAQKNIYKPTTDDTLFGTPAKLFVTEGLTSTNKAFATRWSNLQGAMDGESDINKATIDWSIETRNFYFDIGWAAGVAVVFPENVVIATLA